MDFTSIFLVILFIVNIFFAGVIIFIERKDPAATWAWVMILFFIPVVGFIIYLFLGQNLTRRRMFDWEGIYQIGLVDRINQQIGQIRDRTFSFGNAIVDRYRDLIYMHLINNEAVLTKGNQIEIFNDGAEKFDQLIEDIRSAKHHIHIQYYIFRYDDLGLRMIEELRKKAAEGLEVCLLYDELGSRKMRRRHFRPITDAGGKIGVFFPATFPKINIRLNYRNHRKLSIIDGEIGYIGGFNVGDEYLGNSKKFGYWRDTHLRIKGEAVDPMQTRFILDWNLASKHEPIAYSENYFPPKQREGDAAVQMVSSGPDSHHEQIKNGLMKMVFEAEETIYIQTPYFIPDKSLLDAIQIACLAGKDVRIMIPNKPDHPFVYWATYSHIGKVLETGARVYIYENGFIHSKTMLIDGKINSVGTANIDMRSFKLNFEMNAFIYDEETTQKLTAAFENDMQQSIELTLAMYKRRPPLIRIKESLFRLLSPIL
ncbi:cardiolipin synthase [Salisediminibacterium halotolerans]|uniref:Cardiolipin synthase n=1 Tax=Salisediminibacterium halotolerans TaxID=517425 RepID=A0A1H9RN40_9BACI|nr:cardiolipin synthase [Salisediminibacterium haloalkalitolerans]SER74331.1 cardiolipin synthase [Salisediminibacterium haloalkalitolerans]